MNKKALIVVVFSILLIGGGLYFFTNQKATSPTDMSGETEDKIVFGDEARKLCGPAEPPILCYPDYDIGCRLSDRQWNCYPLKNSAVSSQNDASEQAKQAAQETTTFLPTTEIDTFPWKTYRNEEYGFEVKYPAEWITLTQKQQELGYSVFNSIFGPEGTTVDSELAISILVYDEPSLQKEFELDSQAVDIVIDGKHAIRNEISVDGSSLTTIIIPLDKKFIVLSAPEKFQSDFDLFISTFKFAK